MLRDIQNPVLCALPLPLNKETLDGELPTVSITSNETTFIAVSTNITEEKAAQYDIDLSLNVDYSKDRDFLSKLIYYHY
jgi:hypothetical protein